MRVKPSIAAALFLLATLVGGTVWSQSFPQRPITLLIPYPPGGVTDVSGRLIARTLSETIKQSVVVENVGGAGGVNGMNRLRRARNDGYTLALINRPILVFRPTMDTAFGIEQGKDYVPLAMVAEVPGLFVRRADSKFSTLRELLDHAKSNPGSIPFGSPGVGTANHLAVELLEHTSGARFNHIPYQGEAPAQLDLLAGRIEFAVLGSISKEHIAAGKLVAMASAGKHRWTLFPEVPTVEECGFPNYAFNSWVGLVAPVGIPDDVKSVLSKALEKALSAPELKEGFEAIGMVVSARVGNDFSTYLSNDIAQWRQFVRSSGLTLK